MRYNFSPGVTELISDDPSRGDAAVISLHEVICRGTLINHCSLLSSHTREAVSVWRDTQEFSSSVLENTRGSWDNLGTPISLRRRILRAPENGGLSQIHPMPPAGCWMLLSVPSVFSKFWTQALHAFPPFPWTEWKGRSACGLKFWISGPSLICIGLSCLEHEKCSV